MKNKKEIKIDLKVFILCVVIVLLVMIILALGIYIYYNKNKNLNVSDLSKENIEGNTSNSKKEIIETDLDINSDLVKELNTKILKSNAIYDYIIGKDEEPNDTECSFYKNKKIAIEDLNNADKLVAVLQYLEENENTYGTKQLIDILDKNIINKLKYYLEPEYRKDEEESYCTIYKQEELKQATELLFGEDAKINWFSFIDSAGVAAMEYINGNYYKLKYNGGGYGITRHGYNEIIEAKQIGDYIYIYDKFIYGIDNLNDEEYVEYFQDVTKEKSIGTEELYGNYDLYNADVKKVSDLIEKYSNRLNTYKHTFKKGNNGQYYWLSTEKAN